MRSKPPPIIYYLLRRVWLLYSLGRNATSSHVELLLLAAIDFWFCVLMENSVLLRLCQFALFCQSTREVS